MTANSDSSNMIVTTYQELKYYYSYKFPFDLIYRMIIMNKNNISPSDRDLALFYTNGSCFKKFQRDDREALKSKFKMDNIINIHIGSLIIKNDHLGSLQLKYRYKELVFDIDITDYNRYCECREMKKICQLCWLHIEGSYLILNHFLLERLKYKKENLLWVFSGGKGIHCLINESKAIKLTNEERVNLFNFIYIDKNDDKKLIYVIKLYQNQYPDLIKKLEDHFFKNVISKSNLFSLPHFKSFVLSLLEKHYNPIYSHLINYFNNEGEGSSMIIDDDDDDDENESIKKWKLLLKYENHFISNNDHNDKVLKGINSSNNNRFKVKPSLFIIFKFYYMQIDKQPGTLDHLIKLPFTIHKETKNIALPMEGDKILNFNLIKDTVCLSSNKMNYNFNSDKIFKESITLFENWINQYPYLL